MTLFSLEAMLTLFIVAQYALGLVTKPSAEAKTRAGCHKPADVIFLLDASSSIWGPDFRKQLDFVRTVIGDLRIEPSMVRCGLVTFGDEVRVEFGLRTYSNAETAMKAVSSVSQLRGNTRTDQALLRMREMMAQDKRPGVPQIGIVLTDGESDHPAVTRKEAELAHEEGIALFAVGIGNGVDTGELRAIVSQEGFRFSVGSFDGLRRIQGILSTKACEVEPKNAHNPPVSALLQDSEGCSDKIADVVFVLDGSVSIWAPDFRSQLTFVSDLVALFQVSESGTHVGVITFGDHPVPQFGLDRYSTVSDVQRALRRIAQQMGGTNTADALRYVQEAAFTGKRHRVGAIKIAVVITDGQSQDPASTAREATRLKEDGVSVFAIGVGSGADKTELYSIASFPSDQHVFMVENYAALGSIKQHLISKTCLKNLIEQVSQLPALLQTPARDTARTTTEHPTLSTTPKSTTATTAPSKAIDCQSVKPADIVFSLPSSIDDQETSFGLRFIASMAKSLGVGDDGQIRVALAPRLCHAISGFSLEQGSRADKVSRYIETQSPSGRVDETAAALRYIRDVSFSSPEGAPGRERTKIAVVVIDTRSARLTQATFREASRLMQRGVRVLVIVVGKRTSVLEEGLSKLTDCESCLLRAESYSEISDLVESLKTTVVTQLCTIN